MLSFTIVYFINWGGSGLSLHWAYLIVTGFWFALTALMVWIGIKKLKQVGPPEKAIEQGREIPKALEGQCLIASELRASCRRSPRSSARSRWCGPRRRPPTTWSAVSA